MVTTTRCRSSSRLAAAAAAVVEEEEQQAVEDDDDKKKGRASNDDDDKPWCRLLPRTREQSLLNSNDNIQYVLGIDEAGRGPLAGPVVAAAAYVPTDISGIVDSKKITAQVDRQALYEQITTSPNARWAVAIISAARIDEINILQATLEGMTVACHALLNPQLKAISFVTTNQTKKKKRKRKSEGDAAEEDTITTSIETNVPVIVDAEPSVDHGDGCYVCCGATNDKGQRISSNSAAATPLDPTTVAVLVDGNRLPLQIMPPWCCAHAESIVKGDSKEYSIAAASILAKVTRDGLMEQYAKKYPEYAEWSQNKGYPTASHMALLQKLRRPTPIHRRTFAPLKHMLLLEAKEHAEDDDAAAPQVEEVEEDAAPRKKRSKRPADEATTTRKKRRNNKTN